MDQKLVKQLESTQGNDKKLELLCQWLHASTINLDELFTACDNKKITLNGPIITSLGIAYSQGNNNLSQDYSKSFRCYEYASEKFNYAIAYGNCAQYYFDKRAPGGKDLAKAEQACVKALELKASQHLLYIKILLAQNKGQDAFACFRTLKQDDKNYAKAEELINKHQIAALTTLYQHLNLSDSKNEDSTDSKDENLELKQEIEALEEEKEIVNKPLLPGWYKFDTNIDAFDVKQCNELKARKALAEFKSDMADKSHSTAKSKFDEIEKEKPKNPCFKEYEAIYKEAEAAVDSLFEKKQLFDTAFTNYTDMIQKTLTRQYQTEQRFFNPARTKKKQTSDMAKQLQISRLKPEDAKPIKVENTPMRRCITAERSTLQAAVTALEVHKSANSNGYIPSIGWKSHTSSSYYGNSTQYFTAQEIIQIDETEIRYKQKVNPHVNHLGDYDMDNISNYDNILRILNDITGTTTDAINVENEKKLAQLMLDFASKGMPVTKKKLIDINNELNSEESVEELNNSVHSLNRIFYHCFAKEIARWSHPRDQTHQLPLATAQARALKLIIAGHLTIREVFNQYAPYGVFTGKELGKFTDALRNKVIKINALYNKLILEPNNLSAYIRHFKQNPNSQILPTRHTLHQELLDTYGGASDTDGEGYESDDENEKNLKQALSITF
jgi:hypothetical protein